MKCPFCGHMEDKVIESRAGGVGDVVRRRRECEACQRRFTTYERVEEALPRPPSVGELARGFAMSERTLARHVRAATGTTPSALVQGVRLQRARQLIEATKLTIDQVAAEVGYEDAPALRRLMRRRSGANPSRFRTQLAASAPGR